MSDKPASSTSRFTVRMDSAVLARLRAFVRDHAGKPLYLQLGTFLEQSVAREMDRIESQQSDEPPRSRRTRRTAPSTNHRL